MAVVIRQRARERIRLAFFVGFAVLLLPVIAYETSSRLLFSLSPYLAFSRITSTGTWTLWMIPAVVFVAVVFFRRRFFCRYVCPTGYLLDACGQGRRRGTQSGSRIPILARPLAWLFVGSMVAGYPFLLWMDPLSLFGGVGGLYRLTHHPSSWVVTVPLLVLVLGTVLLPRVWCGRLCPLGGLQDLLADARSVMRRVHGKGDVADPRSRRAFVVLLAGLPAAAVLRRWGVAVPVLRPPGAAPADVFNGLCSRCGTCSTACPQNIIQPDLGETGLAGLLTPVLSFRHGYCDEWCTRCTEVCPTGALRPLTVEQKQAEPLGVALISHPLCLAWGEQKHCVVCQEFCPYQAIDLIDQGGIPCPVVNATRCRGCGACEKECPVTGQKAIEVMAG